jgi:hypothetical protein
MKCCNGNCNQGRACPNRQAGDLGFWQGVAFLVAIILLFGLAGRMDYEDAKLQEEQYCEMVKSGKWPDYNGTYKEHCPVKQP